MKNDAQMATLSIVIVNWNSCALLRQCLLSIRAKAADLRPQIVVVDAGSFDGCGEMIRAEFPDVVFVQSQENVGFGQANNLGLTRVTGRAVLLLNPDTEVMPGALQRLLAELERHPQAGIVAPRLLNCDGTLQSSVHALPRPIRQALDSELLRRLLSPVSWWAPPADFAPAGAVVVEAVAGTCMLLPTTTFRSVGGFSPDYFMYAEDMDLCLKIRRAGLEIYHVPDAEVVHHGGASAMVQGHNFANVVMRQALLIYMRRNHGRLAAFVYRLFSGVAATARLAVISLRLALSFGDSGAILRASRSKWRAVLAWSVGTGDHARNGVTGSRQANHVTG